MAEAKPLTLVAPHNGALIRAMLAKLAVRACLRYGPRHLFFIAKGALRATICELPSKGLDIP